MRPKPKRRLTVQMDELWSFVDHKGDEQWVWLAMDVVTREIVGCYIGDPPWHLGSGTLELFTCGVSPVCLHL